MLLASCVARLLFRFVLSVSDATQRTHTQTFKWINYSVLIRLINTLVALSVRRAAAPRLGQRASFPKQRQKKNYCQSATVVTNVNTQRATYKQSHT